VANVLVIVFVVAAAWFAVSIVRRRRHGLVAERGISIGADLGRLGDAPRVRVAAVTTDGPTRVRLVLTPEGGGDDLDFLVSLSDADFGFGLLRDWQRSQAPLGIVLPPGSRLVRLRSVDDLQPLTLRRVE